MADAPGRPVTIPEVPPPPPPADAGIDEPYRPVSLLAITGFVLVSFYAFFVLLGGVAPLAKRFPALFGLLSVGGFLGGVLLALILRKPGEILWFGILGLVGLGTVLGLGGLMMFSSSDPWLLLASFWAWSLLIGAVLTCWFARTRIQASEGALGGMSLANWGMVIGLFFGLNYAAYLSSSTFAVRGQARQAADEFLQLIQKGEIEQAFLRTLPLRSRPPAGADIRQEIELAHNMAKTPTSAGQFTGFSLSKLVQVLRFEGTDAILEPLGASGDFARGGYEMRLGYRMKTSLGDYEVAVMTMGQELTDASGSRRQWHVDLGKSGVVNAISQTPLGKKIEMSSRNAGALVTEWALKLRMRHFPRAYFDMQPVKDRSEMRAAAVLNEPALLGWAGVGLVGAMNVKETRIEPFNKGLSDFQAGKALDYKEFWASNEKVRKEVIEDLKRIFAGQVAHPEVSVMTSETPSFRFAGDQGVFGIPIRLTTENPARKLGFLVQMEIVVTGPVVDAYISPSDYQITGIKVVRAQTAMPMEGPR